MALRDKLQERARPSLEPGETIQQLFQAQDGPSPYVSLAVRGLVVVMLLVSMMIGGAAVSVAVSLSLVAAIFYDRGPNRIVVVTDRAILILRTSTGWIRKKPAVILGRLPRNTRIGPISGRGWGRISLNGERLFVKKQFHADVEAADVLASS